MKRTPKSLMPAASWLGKVKSAAIVLLVMLFSQPEMGIHVERQYAHH